MEWKEYKLGEVLEMHDILRKPLSSMERESFKGEYPYYGAQGIIDYVKEYRCNGTYMLIAEDGENLSSRTQPIARIVNGKFWVNNHAHIVKTNELADLRYICYTLNILDIAGYVTGSAQPKLSQENLSKIVLALPSLHIQEKIASILSNYDTLIDINTKRIKLLEESARDLYKEWFVRMRFPGYEQTKFVKGIPEKWKVEFIGDLCTTIGGGTPSTSNANYWNGNIKWVTPTDITSKQSLPLIYIEGRITESGLKNSSAKMLPAGAILMTSRASIGFFGICKEPVCTNQGFISIIPNESFLRMYMVYNLMIRKEEIVSNANGATFLEISKSRFRKMEMLVPDVKTLSIFEEKCSILFETVYNLELQNQTLAATRDRLLPRLLSGELKLKA